MKRRNVFARPGLVVLAVLLSIGSATAEQAQVLSSPTALSSTVNGTLVTVAWVGDPTATAYRIQVGTVPGGADVFDGVLSNVTTASGTVPNGLYFWRVFALNEFGSSAASAEAQFTVGSGCSAAPGPPQGFLYTVDGFNVTLQWSSASSGNAAATFTASRIRAGSL